MHRIIRRTTLGASAVALLLAAVASPASAAPAHEGVKATTEYLIEKYPCGTDPHPPAGSPDQWRLCDGTWYHAEPRLGNNWRSIRLVAEVSYNANTGWRTTGMTYLQNKFPEHEKTVHWYCQYPGGTTSRQLSTTSVGGPLPPSYQWGKKWQPCNGQGVGLIGEVHGNLAPSDWTDYRTTVYINSWTSEPLRHVGDQATES